MTEQGRQKAYARMRAQQFAKSPAGQKQLAEKKAAQKEKSRISDRVRRLRAKRATCTQEMTAEDICRVVGLPIGIPSCLDCDRIGFAVEYEKL